MSPPKAAVPGEGLRHWRWSWPLPAEARVGQGSMSGRLYSKWQVVDVLQANRRVADGSIFDDTVLVEH